MIILCIAPAADVEAGEQPQPGVPLGAGVRGAVVVGTPASIAPSLVWDCQVDNPDALTTAGILWYPAETCLSWLQGVTPPAEVQPLLPEVLEALVSRPGIGLEGAAGLLRVKQAHVQEGDTVLQAVVIPNTWAGVAT